MARVAVIGATIEAAKAARILGASPFVAHLTIIDSRLSAAKRIADELVHEHEVSCEVTPIQVDTNNRDELIQALAGHDFVAAGIDLPFATGGIGGFNLPQMPTIPVSMVPPWLSKCSPLKVCGREPQQQQQQMPIQQQIPLSHRSIPKQDAHFDTISAEEPSPMLFPAEQQQIDRGPQVPSWDRQQQQQQVKRKSQPEPKPTTKPTTTTTTAAMKGNHREWEIFAKSIAAKTSIERSKYLKQLTMMGMPTTWRGLLWNYFGGVLKIMEENKGYYAKLHDDKHKMLIEASLSQQLKDKIENESKLKYQPAFCSHDRFQGNRGESRLKRVLLAFVYYCKVNHLDEDTGLILRALLIHMDEEHAFWSLVILTQHLLPAGYVSDEYKNSLNADVNIVLELCKKQFPSVYAALEKSNVDFKAVGVRWLMSMFLRALQFEAAMRIWDIIWYKGATAQAKTLLQCSLALLFESESSFPAASGTTTGVVNSISKTASTISPDKLIQIIQTYCSFVRSAQIEALRLKHCSGIDAAKLFSPIHPINAHICLCPDTQPHVCRPAPSVLPKSIVATVFATIAEPRSRAKGENGVKLAKPGEKWLF